MKYEAMKRMKKFGGFKAASASDYKEKAALIVAALMLVNSWLETPNENPKPQVETSDDEPFDPTDYGFIGPDIVLEGIVKKYSRV